MPRMKRFYIFNGFIFIMGTFCLNFLIVRRLSNSETFPVSQEVDVSSLETKLKVLEKGLLRSERSINEVLDSMQEFTHIEVNQTIARADYKFAQTSPNRCDIRMADVYDQLRFDNPHGGVWRQGFDVTYNKKSVADPNNKLKVFIVPHSHCDPGWLNTFEQYHQFRTRHILDNMVKYLSPDVKRKFIYAEISFFSRWWTEKDAKVQRKVLELLNNGQLEIVGGGWVMNDEANSFYYGILEQYITGHEWLNLNLNGYKPNNGWAIDPFGLSSTMSYILKRAGFNTSLIQRTHYAVKKHMAWNKDLEFMWRQHWDHEDTTDLLTHMMPFPGYGIRHTCGPNPNVCGQFDFRKLQPPSPWYATWPWSVIPVAITMENIAERSFTLLDQYRKKAQLYRTNVVLIPLGDDFRFESDLEWQRQTENYEKIMSYVNGNPALNAQIQWGTLEDYYDAVREESKTKSGSEFGLFKSLSGDFFTYADKRDQYWSGYYTSRPFYKNMDRVLSGYLRAAEISYSLMLAEMKHVGHEIANLSSNLLEQLIFARQNLALFQHHDGVTGTARNHVVIDYGKRMLQSIKNSQNVITKASEYLITPEKTSYQASNGESQLLIDESRAQHFSLPKQLTVKIEGGNSMHRITIFNSHAKTRTEVITLKVSSFNVKLFRMVQENGRKEEENLEFQISPIFKDDHNISDTEYHISFVAQVKGFGLQSYFVRMLNKNDITNVNMHVSSITVNNYAEPPMRVFPFHNIDVLREDEDFSLQNNVIKASFNYKGILQSITTLDDQITTPTRLDFIVYGTRWFWDKSGAYLFLPKGGARVMQISKANLRLIRGKFISYMEVHLPYCKHTVTLKVSPGVDGTGLHIDNMVDIRKMDNKELGMRISSNIDSGDEFFTDLNGFQIIKRKRLAKIPLQANYYPVPSMMYIHDSQSRLNLISRQPLGGSSLVSGQFEVLMDRRLMQDDFRGLDQGITDNLITPHSFFLLLERKDVSCKDEASDVAASYPSLGALAIRHSLINPFYKMIWTGRAASNDVLSAYYPIDKDLACDLNVVNLRTMQANSAKIEPSSRSALIIHRNGFNGCYKPVGMNCKTNGGKFNVNDFLPKLFQGSMQQMSLTLLHEGREMERNCTMFIEPMEVQSLMLST